MKKNNKRWIIWLVAGIVAIGGIWFYLKKNDQIKIQLQTTKPVTGDISTSITATGKVQPVDTVAVGTQVSGTINHLYVDFNSKVKKGQLLASIDPTLLREQMLQIRANLESAKSNLAFNQNNYDRQTQLYKVGAISKSDFQTAQNQYNAAKAQLAATTAQLAAANKNLSLTNIYAPIDGTVLNRNVSEGQTVASSFSTPTLFSIAKDLSKMQVQAYIAEADIGNVQVGQKSTFTVDAFPDETFNGEVSEVRMHPTVSSNVVNYITIIGTDNSDMKLKPGMTANISVVTSNIPNVMKIPMSATSFRPDSLVAQNFKINSPFNNGKKQWNGKNAGGNNGGPNNGSTAQNKNESGVWILAADNQTISHKKIRTGKSNDTEIQVISGLDVNDNIITGYKKESNKSPGTAKSPFLPQRPNRNKNQGGSPRN